MMFSTDEDVCRLDEAAVASPFCVASNSTETRSKRSSNTSVPFHGQDTLVLLPPLEEARFYAIHSNY